MKTKKNDLLKKLPSLYDFFYYDFWVLKNLCDVNLFEDFIIHKNNVFKNVYKGYLYLSEIAIIHLINDLEGLINDENISELVHWGDVDVQEVDVMQFIKNNVQPDFTFLFDYRKHLSTLRFTNFDVNAINKIMSELKFDIEKLNLDIVKLYEIKKIINKSNVEKKEILNKIVNRYNYIEFEFIFNPDDSNKDVTPIWLGQPFSYLISPQIRKNYQLQNQTITRYNSVYIKGIAFSFLYLYSKVISKNQMREIEIKLLNAGSWIDINDVREIFYMKILKRHNSFGVRIFDSTYNKTRKKSLSIEEITKKFELKILFRGRDIYVIKHRYDSDYTNTQNLFLHTLFGAVNLYSYNFREKPELIEIKQRFNDNEWGYTYALYSSVGGVIWDSSHWLLFDKLIEESSIETSFYKMQLDVFLKFLEKKIIFHKYTIDDDLLKDFIENNDVVTRKKRIENEKLNTFKGLLSEFLASYYIIKESNLKEIDFNLEIHKDFPPTDIDVLFEINGKRVIFQVKPSLSLKIEDITNHFNIIQSKFNDDKQVEKILFVAEETIDIYPLFNEKSSVTEEDIECRKEEIINIFLQKGIKVISLKSFIDKLQREKSHGDLISKLKTIYDFNDEGNALIEMRS